MNSGKSWYKEMMMMMMMMVMIMIMIMIVMIINLAGPQSSPKFWATRKTSGYDRERYWIQAVAAAAAAAAWSHATSFQAVFAPQHKRISAARHGLNFENMTINKK